MLQWIIPQSDYTLLLPVDHTDFDDMRNFLVKFAVAEKTPDHVHTYKITAISLRNACSVWVTTDEILEWLKKHCVFEIPQNVRFFIQDQMSKYGSIILEKKWKDYVLSFKDPIIQKICENTDWFLGFVEKTENESEFFLEENLRGKLKAFLIKHGYPVEDLAGYSEWDPLNFGLRWDWEFRKYQNNAIDAFWQSGSVKWWSGVIVLACGWGKTIVWIWAMHKVQTKTLVITTTANACFQRKRELENRTNISSDDIGVFSGNQREIKPVTIATYSMLTYRKNKESNFDNMEIFTNQNRWLVIYDEVHVVPAPIFGYVANIQSKRRLGLTATLVREDGQEDMIFCLIWPKKYDLPRKELEKSWHIASAYCKEIRIKMPDDIKMQHAIAEKRQQFAISAQNPAKLQTIQRLLDLHKNDKILILWEYLEQLDEISKMTWIPKITGKMSVNKREELLQKFRNNEISQLILSRVANFAIDLPDANALIEVSGLRWSRQEEAQRLGRILRPKDGDNTAHFYMLVSADSRELEFAENRQMFLIEQWYIYEIEKE